MVTRRAVLRSSSKREGCLGILGAMYDTNLTQRAEKRASSYISVNLLVAIMSAMPFQLLGESPDAM